MLCRSPSDGAETPTTTTFPSKADGGTRPRSTSRYEYVGTVPGGPAKSIHAFPPGGRAIVRPLADLGRDEAEALQLLHLVGHVPHDAVGIGQE